MIDKRAAPVSHLLVNPGGGHPGDRYEAIYRAFRWQVPKRFNIAQVCCARWAAQPNASKNIAIYAYSTRGKGINGQIKEPVKRRPQGYSFAQLQQAANRLSNLLAAQGVQRGDRVAIVMPQRFETAVAYIAVLQMGAVAMPLSMLFGPEALEYRLQNSEAVAAIVDADAWPGVQSVRPQCPALRSCVVVGADASMGGVGANSVANSAGDGAMPYREALAAQHPVFKAADTLADDAAVLIYTSGTTGPPKGALIAHRALIGNLTGFVASQNWLGFDAYPRRTPVAIPSPGGERARAGASEIGAKPSQQGPESQSVFWSPADWAWTGGLMDALLPMLYFGRPIVAYNGRFDPQTALELMRDCGVTHTFLFPTALKAMMKATIVAGGGTPAKTVRQQFGLKLQAIMSAGEAVGDAVFDYCVRQLGVRPNEMFGQTEINYIVGNCNRYWPSRPGSMGKPYPGHWVRVINEAGQECAVGEPGDVAVNRFDIHGTPDPVFFLGYWKNPAATAAKYTGDWCRTGDIAVRDAEGYLWYQGRGDDMFKAAGYRIGPGEVENCLVKHPAVANAAVVPKPDAERGAVVKAYVVLAPDFVAARAQSTRENGQLDEEKARQFDQNLIAALQQHVKGKLAPYEYPKEIEFVEALPMTTTGKVQRRVLRLQEEARHAAAKS